MHKFQIVPLNRAYAAHIRQTMVDDFGHAVIESVASGLGPCRVSLKPFKVNVDSRLLLTHSPFTVSNPYDQAGPIFISKDDVPEYEDIYQFPAEIKANKVSFPLTLIGYNSAQMMVYTQMVEDRDVDLLIAEIFADRADVDYLHARSAKACCFICKIIRLK
jgi:uncharacterized protein DUF1203